MSAWAHKTATAAPRPRSSLLGWMTLILLLAAAFRLVGLVSVPPGMTSIPPGMTSIPPGMTGIPPGMTHDEADHGITAQAIRDGARDIYFTVGYGREPLYDYATAVVMSGAGETIFAARLTAAFFSLVLIAGTFAWARRAFDAPTALLVAAALAVGFWPVMAGRQALRSITLPALFVLAACAFWHGLELVGSAKDRRRTAVVFIVAGILLGLTAYTYIPARVLWLIFPLLVAYRMVATRSWQGRLWAMTGLMLLVALLVAAPLLLHLAVNPGLEVRVAELRAPLTAALGGDAAPLLANVRDSLRLFMFTGDPTWRYNLAGKPWLGPVAGVLFVAGLAGAVWLAARGGWRGEGRPGRASAAFLSVCWLVAGLSPTLVTGPALSTTQAIGLLPVLYLFPALATVAIYRWLIAVIPTGWYAAVHWAAAGLAVAAVALGAVRTTQDYFGRWANEPEVRVQYETAMVTGLEYLDRNGRGDVAVSTITPGPFHSPAVASLIVHNPNLRLHWFDGRQSLLLPPAGGELLLPGFTPVPDTLAPFLAGATLLQEIPMRSDDLDRPLRLYDLASLPNGLLTTQTPPAQFGRSLALESAHLPQSPLAAGGVLPLVVAWRLQEPLPNAMLFAQLVGPNGVVAQADRLGAPGELWRSGDLLLQDLSFTIPPDTPLGTYQLITGVYTSGVLTADDEQRLTADGRDAVYLADIEVAAP